MAFDATGIMTITRSVISVLWEDQFCCLRNDLITDPRRASYHKVYFSLITHDNMIELTQCVTY